MEQILEQLRKLGIRDERESSAEYRTRFASTLKSVLFLLMEEFFDSRDILETNEHFTAMYNNLCDLMDNLKRFIRAIEEEDNLN